MSAIFITKEGVEVERTKCEIFTRVMWYHRPVSSFNIWKKAEFFSRNYFKSNTDFNSQFSEN